MDEREKLRRAKEALRKTTSPYLRRDLTKYIARTERKMKKLQRHATKILIY